MGEDRSLRKFSILSAIKGGHLRILRNQSWSLYLAHPSNTIPGLMLSQANLHSSSASCSFPWHSKHRRPDKTHKMNGDTNIIRTVLSLVSYGCTSTCTLELARQICVVSTFDQVPRHPLSNVGPYIHPNHRHMFIRPMPSPATNRWQPALPSCRCCQGPSSLPLPAPSVPPVPPPAASQHGWQTMAVC